MYYNFGQQIPKEKFCFRGLGVQTGSGNDQILETISGSEHILIHTPPMTDRGQKNGQ